MLLVALLVGLCMPAMAQETTTTQSVADLLEIEGIVPAYYNADAETNTMYYLKNVGTGLMLCYGGMWGERSVESQSAHPIVIEDNGDGTVAIASLGGYLNTEDLYMAAPKAQSKWTLRKVEGFTNQFHIVSPSGDLLSSVGNRAGLLVLKADEGKALQRWIFTSEADMRDSKMDAASKKFPVDASFAIRGGSFDYVDAWNPKDYTPQIFKDIMPATNDDYGGLGYHHFFWQNFSANRVWYIDGVLRSWNPNEYNSIGIIDGKTNPVSVSYTMILRPGVYRFQCQGFSKHEKVVIEQDQKRSWFGADWENDGNPRESRDKESELNATVKISGEGVTIGSENNIINENTAINCGETPANTAIVAFRDNGENFEKNITFYVSTTSEVTITVSKNNSTTASSTETTKGGGTFATTRTRTTTRYDNRIYIDNFFLYYSGKPDAELPAVVDKPWAFKWGEISDWFFWIKYPLAGIIYANTGAWPDENGTYYLSKVPEEGDDLASLIIDKTKYDANNAKYDAYQQELEAYSGVIASSAANTDKNLIFKNQLEANVEDYAKLLPTQAAKDEFYRVLRPYLDNDNTVKTELINSRKTYYNAVELMEEAFARAMAVAEKEKAENEIEIDPDKEDHIDFSGAIFNHTFDLFRFGDETDPYKNKPIGWDYVNAGTADNDVRAGDTFVAVDKDNFAMSDVDGLYYFNTWKPGRKGGAPISQTVEKLPAGTYLLSALMTTDPDKNLCIFGGSSEENYRKKVYASSYGETAFDDYGVRVEVVATEDTNDDGKLDAGDAYLGVAGAKEDGECDMTESGNWYKCDNFRLEYLPGGVLTLKETAVRITNIVDDFEGARIIRSITRDNWSTLVLPFDMPRPDNWQVEKLDVVDQSSGDIRLTFKAIGNEENLQAGVPYIVRVPSDVKTISATDVEVNTILPNPSGPNSSTMYDVEFVPVYKSGYIPASELEKNEDGTLKKDDNGDYIPTGAQYYFLSGGKLKRCVYDAESGKGNKIKGFRAYFKVTPKTAEARMALRSLSMRTSEETDIENVAEEEVTVIGIYDVNGIRLSEMKPGINILRMNNGTTKKVMVK